MLQATRRTRWMVAISVVAACGLLGSAALAGPVNGRVLPVQQPDGSTIQARIWGDEFYTVVESLDGYTLVRDPATKVICYARLSADGNKLISTGVRVGTADPADLGIEQHIRIDPKAAAAQARAVREARIRDALAQMPLGMDTPTDGPTTGEVEGITLIIDFSDDPGTIPPGKVWNYCNQVGYGGDGNNGSVRDYYYDVSNHYLTYTNFVPDAYYRALHPKTYYNDPSVQYGVRARELITEALDALVNNPPPGFGSLSDYDADNDGYVDALNCFYAGFSNSAWAEGLWPHASWINYCADGVCTRRYQMTDMQNALTLSTFCHENGHMLMGWPDLYDYDYDSAGVGRFCLMCSGTSDTNPCHPCGPLKDFAGWTDTRPLTVPQMGLEAPYQGNVVYKFPHPTLPNEYYIVENRQRIGRDLEIPDAGLAIWHVDTEGNNSWQQQLPDHHYLVTLVQADGEWDLEHDRNQGDSTDLWAGPSFTQCSPATDPNTDWWAGNESLLSIMHISQSDPLMTFTFITSDIDCNNNGVPDDDDLLSGYSQDCNANDLPDECDIDSGFSEDCNNNRVPDDCDLDSGYSDDCNENGIPDECDMNPGSLVVTSTYSPSSYSVYHLLSGTLRYMVECDFIPAGAEYGPNGNLFIWAQDDGPLWEYNGETGELIGIRVDEGAGGTLLQGRGITFMPDGDILVAGGTANRVPRFDWDTGAYLGDFIATGSGGLTTVWGIAYGPNGNLFATSSATGEILEYDGQTGAFVGVFVAAGAGDMDRPYDLEFGPRGDLYVSARNQGLVYRFDGVTGDPLGAFTQVPIISARGITFGPNGNLFVAASPGTLGGGAYEFDGQTGELVKHYPAGSAGFVTFKPWAGQMAPDCNLNGIPDECDIDSGLSTDFNANGIPDECDSLGDLNCDDRTNFDDINPFVLAMTNPDGYAAQYPGCPFENRDINGDQSFDPGDINPFIAVLLSGPGNPQP